MNVRSSATPRRLTTVGLAALALSLPGAPALALDAPLPQLDTVTEPVAHAVEPVVDPVVEVVSPPPSDEADPEPLPVPVPEPLKPVVDPVVEQVIDLLPENPVTGNGSEPEPVPAPGSGAAPGSAAAPAPAPAARPAPPARPAPATAVAARSTSGGSGAAALDSLGGVPALSAGTGTVSATPLGAPLLAAAPSFSLPGLEPLTAPAEIAADRPSSAPPVTPAGLPALVVAVAAVALAAAGAGHVAELRARRAAATD